MSVQPQPRLVDVAELAGVSVKTASRVMNGEPGVRPDKVKRVQEAAERLHFRRNEWARMLRTKGPSSMVGVITGAIDDPFWAGAIGSLGRGLGDDRYVLSATTEEDPTREATTALEMIERQVMALVLVPVSPDQSYLVPTLKRHIPVVAIDRPARGIDVDTVLAADQAGARAGTELLLDVGHRDVAFIGRSSRYTTGQRLRGFRKALADKKLPSRPELITTEADDHLFVASFVDHLRSQPNPPTAVFSANVAVTVSLLSICRERDWYPGMVAFSDFATSDSVDPPMTVIDNSPHLLGQHAAELIQRRLDGDRREPTTVQIDTPLIIRESHLRFP